MAVNKFKTVSDMEALIADTSGGRDQNMKTDSSDNSQKKEVPVNINCTPDEYKKLEKVSSNQNQSMEEYILDMALKEGGRRSRKNRRMVTAIVNLQQTINELSVQVKKTRNKKNLVDYVDKLQEGMDDLWQS